MSNKIPREFNRIVGKMLIDTNLDKEKDIIYITKNERGLLAFNTRTQKYAHCFIDMLRNNKVFELISIE